MSGFRGIVVFAGLVGLVVSIVLGCGERLGVQNKLNKVYISFQNTSLNGSELSDIHSEIITPLDTEEFEFDILTRRDLGYPRIEYVINSYESTIKRNADRYGFDWRLILAVMNQESRFRLQAVSHRGAYGLMQIMPATGQDISSSLNIDNVNHPKDNIAGGVYYLWRMYRIFGSDNNGFIGDDTDWDGIQLALAAYNAGPARIIDAKRLAEFLNLDSNKWEVIRDILPMLSRQYYSLHSYVWETGRPSGGYFNGWRETVNYVESVMYYYEHYQKLF